LNYLVVIVLAIVAGVAISSILLGQASVMTDAEGNIFIIPVWKKDTLNVAIETTLPLQFGKLDAVKEGIFSTEKVGNNQYLGWQGVFDEINRIQPDNSVPDRFILVESSDDADIIVILTEEVFEQNGSTLGDTRFSAGAFLGIISPAIITIYNVDDQRIGILASVTRHEVGHALGHPHIDEVKNLMSPQLITQLRNIGESNLDLILRQHG